MSDKEKPMLINETEGTKYYCSCSKSKSIPYCDGSHSGTDHKPYKVEIEKERKVAICTCSKSGKMPFCDGSHSK